MRPSGRQPSQADLEQDAEKGCHSMCKTEKSKVDLPPEKESSYMLDWKIRKGAIDGQKVLHT